MEIKFNICDEVFYLNTASGKFEEVEIKSAKVIPTGMHADENGKNVLDSVIVLYETTGPVLAETELFRTKEEALDHWLGVLKAL